MIAPSEKIRVVELSPPNPEWVKLYSEESNKIKMILQKNLVDIYHKHIQLIEKHIQMQKVSLLNLYFIQKYANKKS